MLKGDSLRKADIVTGIILILLGGAVIWGASSMPMGGTYGGVDNPWYASPAAFPLFLGGLLIAGGATVSAKGIRTVGFGGLAAFLSRVVKAPWQRSTGRRGTVVAVTLAGYYALLRLQLFGAQNYVVCSALFLASLAIIFYRPAGKMPQASRIVIICIAAVLISAGVAALFSGPLRVPLP